MPVALFLCLKTALGSLWVQINVRVVSCIYLKDAIGNLVGITLKALGGTDILIVLVFLIYQCL